MNKRWLTQAMVSLALMAGLSQAISLQGELVWDDVALIEHNVGFQDPSRIWEALSSDYFSTQTDPQNRYGYYRPVSTLSLALTAWIFVDTPWPYHLTNILLHIGCTLLLFFLGIRIGLARISALSCALLFSVHPGHVESVSWISGRTDLLATFFGLGSLLILERAVESSDSLSRYRRVSLAIGGTLLYTLALLSKEVTLVLPLIFVVLARAGLNSREKSSWTRIVWVLSGVSVITVVYAILRFVAIPLPSAELDGIGLVEKLASALGGIARYAWLFLWPVPQQPYMQVPQSRSFLGFYPLMGLAITVAVITFWFRRDEDSSQERGGEHPQKGPEKSQTQKRRRNTRSKGRTTQDTSLRWLIGVNERRQLAAISACALLSVIPMLNLVRLASPDDMGFTMAERFLYLPSVFFCLLLGWFVDRLLQIFEKEMLVPLAAVAVITLVALAWVSHARALTWRDEVSLFRQAVETTPRGTLPHLMLSQAYRKQGMSEEAHKALLAAHRAYRQNGLEPPAALKVTEAGLALQRGDLERAAALLSSSEVQQLQSAVAHRDLALIYRLQGRSEEAGEQLERALALSPDDPRTWLQKALLHLQNRELNQAEAAVRRSNELSPRDPATLHAAGMVQRSKGNLGEAERLLREALRETHGIENDETIRLRQDLGVVLSQMERHDEAIEHLRITASKSQGSVLAELVLAVALLRAERLEEGIMLLERLALEHPQDQRVLQQLQRARRAQRVSSSSHDSSALPIAGSNEDRSTSEREQ